MKILVCGGRDYNNFDYLYYALDTAVAQLGPFVVIHGGCRGADRLACDWANTRGIPVEEFPANWDAHGKAAGFIRNTEMILACDRVIAFWDGKSKGTAHTIGLAKDRGIPVHVIEYKMVTVCPEQSVESPRPGNSEPLITGSATPGMTSSLDLEKPKNAV